MFTLGLPGTWPSHRVPAQFCEGVEVVGGGWLLTFFSPGRWTSARFMYFPWLPLGYLAFLVYWVNSSEVASVQIIYMT